MSLRHYYYYGVIETQKNLFEQEKPYYRLMKLVGSEKNILLSIKLISENSGRNTCGLDGLRYKDLMKEKPSKLVKEIRRRIYYAPSSTSKRVYIPKDNGKKRPLGIQSIYDRIVQQCFLNILEPITEKRFHKNNLGFRTNIDGLQKGQQILQQQFKGTSKRRYVIDVDLESYFDNINVDYVLDILRYYFGIKDTFFLKRLKDIMVNKWYENGKINYSPVGVPQGSILGPVFGNVLLHPLDMELESFKITDPNARKYRSNCIRRGKWKEYRSSKYGKGATFEFVRFADDIRIITYTECEANEIMNVIANYCDRYSIKLSREKTKIEYTRQVNFTGLKIRHDRTSQIRSVSNPEKVWKKVKKSIKVFRDTDNVGQMMSTILGELLFMRTTTNPRWLISRIEYQMFLIDFREGRVSCKLKINHAKENGKRSYTLGSKRPITVNFWDLWNKYKEDIKKPRKESYKDRFNVKGKIWVDVIEYVEGSNSPLCIYVPGLLHKQRFKCARSGVALTPYNYHVHHKIPLKDGGTNDFNNLQLITRSEHKKIHSSN